ncbi:MAG: hypothetical protein J1E62_04005 [Lachnospiraceae bacterium]|nr:hypothetical protein [Lachnospiraceae bacterium]
MNRRYFMLFFTLMICMLCSCGVSNSDVTTGQAVDVQTEPPSATQEELKEVGNEDSENIEDPWGGLDFSQIDWTAYKEKLGAEEYELLQSYMPVLTGDSEFTWLEEISNLVNRQKMDIKDGRKNVTLRKMIAELQDSKVDDTELYLDSLAFCDVFQKGSKDLILNLTNVGRSWVIFHYEGDELYGIYLPIRWLKNLQTNGMHWGSGGGNRTYYRMEFLEDGISSHTLAKWDRDVGFFIGNQKVSEDEFTRWEKKHFSKPTEFYVPVSD